MALSSTERANSRRQRLKEAGMVEIRVWVRPEHRDAVANFAKDLTPSITLSDRQKRIFKKVVLETRMFPPGYYFYIPYMSPAWEGATQGDRLLIAKYWKEKVASGKIEHVAVVSNGADRDPYTYKIKGG